MHRSTSLRLFAHHAAARANRLDLQACASGLDSAAVLVVRSDRRVRMLAKPAGLHRAFDAASGRTIYRRLVPVSTRIAYAVGRVGQQTRRARAIASGKVGPGTGRSGHGCRDGYDKGHG